MPATVAGSGYPQTNTFTNLSADRDTTSDYTFSYLIYSGGSDTSFMTYLFRLHISY